MLLLSGCGKSVEDGITETLHSFSDITSDKNEDIADNIKHLISTNSVGASNNAM